MNKDELRNRLETALETFVQETKHLDNYSQTPISEGELKEVVKQVYYVLSEFKDALLDSVS